MLDPEKIRERITPATSFRTQAEWRIGRVKAERILNKKTREPIGERTIDYYSDAIAYAKGKSDLLFSTAEGRPLIPRNLLQVLHHRVGRKVGFHAFRRFRLTWLRKNAVPKDLERFWMGHAPEEVGDLYSKLKDDVSFRQEWAERVGLGFELVHKSTQNAAEVDAVKAA